MHTAWKGDSSSPQGSFERALKTTPTGLAFKLWSLSPWSLHPGVLERVDVPARKGSPQPTQTSDKSLPAGPGRVGEPHRRERIMWTFQNDRTHPVPQQPCQARAKKRTSVPERRKEDEEASSIPTSGASSHHYSVCPATMVAAIGDGREARVSLSPESPGHHRGHSTWPLLPSLLAMLPSVTPSPSRDKPATCSPRDSLIKNLP